MVRFVSNGSGYALLGAMQVSGGQAQLTTMQAPRTMARLTGTKGELPGSVCPSS